LSKFERYKKKTREPYVYPHKHCQKCGQMIEEKYSYCKECYKMVKEKKEKKRIKRKAKTKEDAKNKEKK